MDLGEHIEGVRRQLVATAGIGGGEAAALAEQLVSPLESAMRLAIQDALAAAVEEITCELAPGSVELRLRGRDPEFVVSLPQPELSPEEHAAGAPVLAAPDGDEGTTARVNLRLPEHLKLRVEEAAAGEGLSSNAWLVRTIGAALERGGSTHRESRRASSTGSQRYTGWSR